MKRLFCLASIAILACPLVGCENKAKTEREIRIETPRSSTVIKTEKKEKDPE